MIMIKIHFSFPELVMATFEKSDYVLARVKYIFIFHGECFS